MFLKHLKLPREKCLATSRHNYWVYSSWNKASRAKHSTLFFWGLPFNSFRRVMYFECESIWVAMGEILIITQYFIINWYSWSFWCVCAQSLSCVWLCVTQWTVALQAPLSMEFPRQEYWGGLLFPAPGDLLDPGIEPSSLASPALTGGPLTTGPPGNLHLRVSYAMAQNFP